MKNKKQQFKYVVVEHTAYTLSAMALRQCTVAVGNNKASMIKWIRDNYPGAEPSHVSSSEVHIIACFRDKSAHTTTAITLYAQRPVVVVPRTP